ncbi:MAG TPA: DUF1735 domain-containing protein [Chitinophagaceae bacterium]|nr:DUF1735 domain-containing protein [Chitinophagaceae bacterium]
MRSINTAILAASVLLLQGCLKSKDVNFANQSSPTPNTVDFNNQTESAALDISTQPTIYTFYAELNSSTKSYPAGTTVTITKTPSVVTGAGYEFMPDSAYQLMNNTATVDPATHLAAFQLKVFTTKIDLTHAFAVGYTITAASNGVVIAGNKNTTLVIIGAKNQWDGAYNVRGYTLRAGDNMLTGHFSGQPYELITFGVNAVNFNRLQVWGDGVTGVAIDIPRLTINTATNAVTISSAGGATNMPGYPSRYDPATKTFYIGFTWGAGPGVREAYDTMVYVGPRP